MKNKKKVFILLVVGIAIIYSAFRIYNIYKFRKVFNEISNAMTDLLEQSNFTYEVKSNSENVMDCKKLVYNKDKVALQRTNAIYYADLSKKEMYVANTEDKTYIVTSTDILPQIKPEIFIDAPLFYSVTQINNLQLLFFVTVSEEKINDRECYKISIFDEGNAWIDKNTLMPVKWFNEGREYNYTVIKNNVTEDDVVFSDINNYASDS